MHIHLSYFDLFVLGVAAGGIWYWRASKKNKLNSSTSYTYAEDPKTDNYYVKREGTTPYVRPRPDYVSPWTETPASPRTINPWVASTPQTYQRPVAPPTTAPAPPVATYTAPVPQTVVHEHYHGGSSGSDMLTGVLVGEMIAGGGRGYGGGTTVVNNNTVVEPANHAADNGVVDSGSWNTSTPAPVSAPDNSSSGWDFNIGGGDSGGGFDVSIGSDC